MGARERTAAMATSCSRNRAAGKEQLEKSNGKRATGKEQLHWRVGDTNLMASASKHQEDHVYCPVLRSKHA